MIRFLTHQIQQWEIIIGGHSCHIDALLKFADIIKLQKMMNKIIAFVAVMWCLSAFTIIQNEKDTQQVSAIPWPFTICGDGDWTIEKFSLASVPTRNTNNDMDALGTANSDTSFTTVEIYVKLNGVFLHSENTDFKKSYQEGDTVEFKYQNFVPGFAPPGTYSLEFRFKNGDKANGCLGMTFKL